MTTTTTTITITQNNNTGLAEITTETTDKHGQEVLSFSYDAELNHIDGILKDIGNEIKDTLEDQLEI